MDKIKFAKLIGFLAKVGLHPLSTEELQIIDSLVTQEPPLPVTQYASYDDANELIAACAKYHKEGEIIPVIKAYRTLTGLGLREAKDVVEKHLGIGE